MFLPFEFGIAHITRSLAIAEELERSSNLNIIFALPKRKHYLINSSSIKLIDATEYYPTDHIDVFKLVGEFNKINSFAESDIKILKKYKPDYVVVDNQPSALIAASVLDLPICFIDGGVAMPYPSYLPFPPLPVTFNIFFRPLLLLIVNHLKKYFLRVLIKSIKKLGRKISDSEIKQHIDNITIIVPETKNYLPTDRPHSNIHYVNPIFWEGFENNHPAWLKEIKPAGKTIYLTFGGTGINGKKLIDLSNSLIQNGYTVIVSTSTIIDPKEFPIHSNLYVERYLPGLEVSKRVDFVICHGGYGTMMQAIMSGKPILALPFNPDQVLHALRFQELGLGKCLLKPSFQFYQSLLSRDWQMFEKLANSASVETILASIEEITNKRNIYDQKISNFQKQFGPKSGSKQAADIIRSEVEKIK